MNRLIALLFISSILFAGCKKSLDNSCENLVDAMQTNNVSEAKESITVLIQSLPSDLNTSQNLQNLASRISGKCSLVAQVFCFGCIYTLPEQSEIQITFLSRTPTLTKTIDISHDSKNRMKFVNMHD